jgi:hypothetical protein
VLAFLLSAIEEYSEAPDIPEGSGASSISDSAMILPVRGMSTAIVHGVRRASIKQPSNSSTDQGGGKRRVVKRSSCENTARMGDEGKAVRRRGAPTALLFEQGGQYRISKSKYAVSIMAVTLATESTKASRASWWPTYLSVFMCPTTYKK